MGLTRGLPHSRAPSVPFPAGVNRFCQDIVDMIGQCPPWCSQLVPYFKACWVIFTPGMLLVGQVIFLPPPPAFMGRAWAAVGWPPTPWPSLSALLPLQFILFYIFLDLSDSTLHYGEYRFPRWGQVLGICMGVLSCIQIPLWAGVALCKESGTLAAVSRGREPSGSREGPLVGKTSQLSPCRAESGRAPGVSILCRS